MIEEWESMRNTSEVRKKCSDVVESGRYSIYYSPSNHVKNEIKREYHCINLTSKKGEERGRIYIEGTHNMCVFSVCLACVCVCVV
jgi:hypothetical protein